MSKRDQAVFFTMILSGMFLSGNSVGAIVVAILLATVLNLPEPKREEAVSEQLKAMIAEQDKKIQNLKEVLELVRISRGR